MCVLRMHPLADADPQNFLDLRTDGGSFVDKKQQTDMDLVYTVSLPGILFLANVNSRS